MKKVIYFIALSTLPTFILSQKDPKPKKVVKTENRTAIIANNIEDESLVYNSFWGKFSPSEFTVFIDGKEIKKTMPQNIKIVNNTLTIRYDYAFGNHRKGSKEITFSIPKDKKDLDLTFSWKKKSRLLIDDAKVTDIKKIKRKKKRKK